MGAPFRVVLSQLCRFIWPVLGGGSVLALLMLVVFGIAGGHYGELLLLFYGPVALALVGAAAMLRVAARKLARPEA